MKNIAIYCESDFSNYSFSSVSFELISKAYRLKQKARELTNNPDYNYSIDAIVLADVLSEDEIQKAYKAGADRVELYTEPYATAFSKDPEAAVAPFVEYCQTTDYDCILFPATTRTRMVAPRITTILNTGLVADCTNLDFVLKDEKIMLAPTRPTFGSELMATILSKTNPQCATIRPNTFSATFNSKKQGEFVQFCVNLRSELNVKLLSSVIDEAEQDSYFKGARIVLGCGFGISGDNGIYYKKVEELAQKINAKVASTRKVVGYGYMEHKTQVGQTGETIMPEIYIAFGISGAMQHVCGMKNSRTIIAVNTDENAEIFKYSDYKIVDDAKKIIDELLEKYS